MARLLCIAFLAFALAFAAAAPRCADAASTGLSAAAAQRQLTQLVTFLNRTRTPQTSGYNTLLRLLLTTNLPANLTTALRAGVKLTVLAPTNAAFTPFLRAYKGKVCEPTVDTVLRLHLLPIYAPAATVLGLSLNTMVRSLSPVPVTKLSQKPLTLGVNDGFGKIYTRANVTAPNAYNTSYVVVHAINNVLVYPPGTPKC